MKKLFLFVFVFFALHASSQTRDWQKTRAWKIYDLRDKKGMRMKADSLKQFRSMVLDDDSVKYFLKGEREIPHGDEPVWMGAIILSCLDSSGIFLKVDVSVYGGFFYDEQFKKYFQVRDEVKEEWMAYLDRKGTERER
ncbi:MAG TPA: hypothetical protein VKR53_03345 [Puia sp.]|nr:hypothetical protein [Puia sp.]